MDNNFDRTQLLKTALEHATITIDELGGRLGLTPILLYHNLESEAEADATIKAVSAALGIPEAYFWGGFYYDEHGQLVPSEPQ